MRATATGHSENSDGESIDMGSSIFADVRRAQDSMPKAAHTKDGGGGAHKGQLMKRFERDGDPTARATRDRSDPW